MPWFIYCIAISHCLLVHSFNALPPGVLCPRKRFPQSDIQEHLLAKQVVRCAWSGNEGILRSIGATGSALVVYGTVAAERSTFDSEGELYMWNVFCHYPIKVIYLIAI